jgi:hypothetical protein
VDKPAEGPVDLCDMSSWRQPDGPGSSIQGRENNPVVHIAWGDCKKKARATAPPRWGSPPDTGPSHIGFRSAMDAL